MDKIGKYLILENLGQGRYASVYRAVDNELGREVALKVLKPDLTADESALKRFRHEAQILSTLVHPHIAFAWDMGQEEGYFYLALRYVQGSSLAQLIKERGPLPWEQTLIYLQQLADALDFAHHKGYLHRDIKPANILIGQEQGAVLTDFGLVALQDSGMTTHSGETILGTPAYIAPEIWQGERASPTSDQYSLACVAVEILGGEVAFPGDTPAAVMKRHVLGGPNFPPQWPSNVPSGLNKVLKKALDHEPERRFASASELVSELRSLDEKTAVTQDQENIINRAVCLPAWTVGLGAALVLVLLAAALISGAVAISARASLAKITPGVPVEAALPAQEPILTNTQTYPPGPTDTYTIIPTPSPTGLPALITDDFDVEMVLVPAGPFWMGSEASAAQAECKKVDPDSVCEREWFEDEAPLHTVTLEDYYLDLTEVSNAMYAECVSVDMCQPPTSYASETRQRYYGDPQFDDYPVINVSWDQASTYCDWRAARLPSETEWEKAARGTDGRLYPWGNTFNGKNMNFCDSNCAKDWANDSYNDGYADTAPLGSYPEGASPYGALDMAGNVWEWVADWYDVYPGGDPGASTNFGQEYRVLRGGSWNFNANNVRTANRLRYKPNETWNSIGFRCARSP